MVDELKLSDLVEIPTGKLSEAEINSFHGTKTKIASAIPKKEQSGYDGDIKLPDGKTIEVAYVAVTTEPIGKNNLGQPVTVTEKFPLKKHPVTGQWGPSSNDKAKSVQFFKSLKINRFEDCIGKDAVVVKRTNKVGNLVLSIAF